MRKVLFVLSIAFLMAIAVVPSAGAGAKPKVDPVQLLLMKLTDSPLQFAGLGNQGGGTGFSKEQFERFTCSSSGDPTAAVDMSCNDSTWAQDFSPDNEIAISADPADPNHLVAG